MKSMKINFLSRAFIFNFIVNPLKFTKGSYTLTILFEYLFSLTFYLISLVPHRFYAERGCFLALIPL